MGRPSAAINQRLSDMLLPRQRHVRPDASMWLANLALGDMARLKCLTASQLDLASDRLKRRVP